MLQQSLPACPQQAPFDDGADVCVLEDVDAVAWGGHENPALAPLARPDGGGGDFAVPGVPLADFLGGGGEDVDVVVGEDPVLLGDEVKVANAFGDRMMGGFGEHVDCVGDVVVGLLAGALIRMLAGVAGELAAYQVQVIRVVPVRVRDPAVPAGQPGAVFNCGTQP